ncbi:hypothetical protein D3C80_817900 [compost metagenome]
MIESKKKFVIIHVFKQITRKAMLKSFNNIMNLIQHRKDDNLNGWILGFDHTQQFHSVHMIHTDIR